MSNSKATQKPDTDSGLGTLIVVLLKARNLNDKHSFRKQDVFAQATLNGVEKRSQVDIKGGQHPEWDSETRFTVLKGNGAGGKNRKLEVACYAPEPRKEELLGKAIVDISDTLKTGEFDDWVSLDVDGVVRGDIYLEMTYYANVPATASDKFLAPARGGALGRRPSKLSPSDRLSRPTSIQQNAAGLPRFSPKKPSRLHDQSNPTLSHVNNPASPIAPTGKNGSLPALSVDGPVHASSTLSDTRDRRSLSPPRVVPSQTLALPSILRPGLGGSSPPISISNPRPQSSFGHNRTPSNSSLSSNRLTPGVSLSPPNPYIGGIGTYTPVHQLAPNERGYSPAPPGAFISDNRLEPATSHVKTSEFSNIDGPPNPYIGDKGGACTSGQQYTQASSGRVYPTTPPGAFIPENQPGTNGRSYSPASRVQASDTDGAVSPNPYTGGSGSFIQGGQQQVSGGRAYPSVPLSVSVQASGPSYPSVPTSISPPNSYSGTGVVYLPENHQRPNTRYSPTPPVSLQPPGSSNIDYSGPKNPYTGGSPFINGQQQLPSGRVCSSTPPVNAAPLIHTNYVLSPQTSNSPSLPWNVDTSGSSVLPGPLAFPIPVVPVAVESYGYNGPSPVSNNRSEREEALDPYHLARYQTPLPLPPGSIKEGSPLPPPPAPDMATPTPVSFSPPAVVPAPVHNAARVETLRKIEQDAAKRREQELKDLELAMQLDQELNL